MAFRWVSSKPDGRTNHGHKRSWFFPTEDEAKSDAVKTATGKSVDGDLLALMWRQLEAAGWSIETE